MCDFMQVYQNLKGDSGISHYEIGTDYVAVKFKGSAGMYVYKTRRVGKSHVERMKTLAQKGQGLSTYISQHPTVREGYVLAENQRQEA